MNLPYRRLGRTGMQVSALCLGTMQFGWSADRAAAFAVMDAFVAAGGNFLDSANIYSMPNTPVGTAETVIGEWMQQRNNRHEIVLATKARGRMWEGPNGEGLSRGHLIKACDDSLCRLQTDYIDLYQTHWYDAETPIEETLGTLTDLQQAGKLRYIGCSNIPVWRLALALGVSKHRHLARYDSLQPHYNLAHRAEFERELQALCVDQSLGVVPYSPLAGGFLTGKYHEDAPVPESVRASGIQRRYFNAHGWAILNAVRDVAAAHGAAPAQVALAWLMGRPAVTAPIIGANTPEQLADTLRAIDVPLTDDQRTQLDTASAWEQD